MVVFPVAGERRLRLIGTGRDEQAEHSDTLKFEDVSGRTIEHMKVEVRKLNWFSHHPVHHRMTKRFRVGRAFLLGDAAPTFTTLSAAKDEHRHRRRHQFGLEAGRGGDNLAPLSVVEWQAHVYAKASSSLLAWCTERGLPLHVFEWEPKHSMAGRARDALYLIRLVCGLGRSGGRTERP